MNEKIDQLIYESGLVAQGCWDKFDEYDRQALNKFAELIVRECIQVVDNTMTENQEMNIGLVMASAAIVAHFRVED